MIENYVTESVAYYGNQPFTCFPFSHVKIDLPINNYAETSQTLESILQKLHNRLVIQEKSDFNCEINECGMGKYFHISSNSKETKNIVAGDDYFCKLSTMKSSPNPSVYSNYENTDNIDFECLSCENFKDCGDNDMVFNTSQLYNVLNKFDHSTNQKLKNECEENNEVSRLSNQNKRYRAKTGVSTRKSNGKEDNVSVVGMGLVNAIAGKSNKFMVIMKKMSPLFSGKKHDRSVTENDYRNMHCSGQLSVALEGPSKATINLRHIYKGVYLVQFLGEKPGFYTCIIKINRMNIRDSPFIIIVRPNPKQAVESTHTLNIESTGIQFERIENNRLLATVTLLSDKNMKHLVTPQLKAYVKYPSGLETSAAVNYNRWSNTLMVNFVSEEEGRHLLAVVNIDLSEVNNCSSVPERLILYNPYPIWINHHDTDNFMSIPSLANLGYKPSFPYGRGMCYAYLNIINHFFLDIGDVSSKRIKVEIDGPCKPEVVIRPTQFGFYITYRPAVLGIYTIKILDKSTDILGSPFKIRVFENSADKNLQALLNCRVLCYGRSLTNSHVDEWNHFFVQVLTTRTTYRHMEVHGPTAMCSQTRFFCLRSDVFLVSFMPTEIGKHVIIFRFQDNSDEAAPFSIMVR